MNLAQIIATMTDRTALALTLWAEARGDWREGHSSVEERIAVGCVLRNRKLAKPGQTYKGLCIAPKQFSCWNDTPGDPNHEALKALAIKVMTGQPSNDPLYDETLFLAEGIISGKLLDQTGGALNYYAPKAMKPAGRVPTWAAGKTARPIGQQLFLVA